MGLNWRKYLPWILVAILSIILFFRKPETVSITIPEKTGQFERDSTQLKPVIKYDTLIKEGKKEMVRVANPINQDLLKRYKDLNDSVSRLEQYKEVITERTYKETYTDSTQSITVESEVIGTLKSQKVDYKIFPQTIEVKTKTQKYHLYGGISTIITPTPTIEPKLTLQSPKMLYSVGYNLNEKALTAGIQIRIF